MPRWYHSEVCQPFLEIYGCLLNSTVRQSCHMGSAQEKGLSHSFTERHDAPGCSTWVPKNVIDFGRKFGRSGKNFGGAFFSTYFVTPNKNQKSEMPKILIGQPRYCPTVALHMLPTCYLVLGPQGRGLSEAVNRLIASLITCVHK